MLNYKRPESVLVVIVSRSTQRYLMMQRQDDQSFWQSVTGSLEQNETPWQTAIREVKEETGIDVIGQSLELYDCRKWVVFDIFPQFLHRYEPGVIYNKEHWFYLLLEDEMPVKLTEHLCYQWLSLQASMERIKSPNNSQAISACQQWLQMRADEQDG